MRAPDPGDGLDYRDLQRDDGHQWREDALRALPEAEVEQSLLQDGKELMSQDEWDSAYVVCRVMVRRFPINLLGWQGLACAAEKLGREEEARVARARYDELRLAVRVPSAYDSAVRDLLEGVPEFAASAAQWCFDLPYVVYGEFASYVCRLVDRQDEFSRSSLRRAFGFINRLAETEDTQLINLLQTTVLEMLTDTKESRATARALLAPRPRAWFEEMLARWLKPADE